ncbi:MAG: phosphoglycerate dehydrogenase [Chloroflexi bacterium]|nr:phosphoglycerate dehydrogenase [Chloroflexota bacterium]
MKVLVTEPLVKEAEDFLRRYTEVTVKVGLSADELLSIVGDYDALLVRSQTRVTGQLIAAARKLQVIGRAGVGVDNIDLEAATKRGILVVNAPAGNITSTAEHTIAMLLALARYIPQASVSVRSGAWQRGPFRGTEVRNKTLGIIGLGRVGSEVAALAKGLKMRVVAYDPMVSADYSGRLSVTLVSLEELLRQADFVTVHVPLTPATAGLIGPSQLELVKPTARFINCARGGIIDEAALYQALEEGRVAGAALDVFSREPPGETPLLKSGRVIATPHLAASTAEAEASVGLDIAEQVIAALQGKPVRYPVNAPGVTAETLAVLGPYLSVGTTIGHLAIQLSEGQLDSLLIRYEGEIAGYDTNVVKAAVLGGLLESISEERVNLVNANIIAASRGLKIAEQKETGCQNYANLLAVQLRTTAGVTSVAGTSMRGQVHIVQINEYWIEFVPSGGYLLVTNHKDRPGIVGAVGTILGDAGVNISNMQVSRDQPGGKAMMALCLDNALDAQHHRQILDLPDMYSAKMVKL